MLKHLLLLLFLGAPFSSGVGAPFQAPAVGERLPPIEIEGLTQTEARSFSDFYGRTVLIEFFAHWCPPCAASVPHLEELQEKFGSRGLSIVAVTAEDAEKTVPWIKKRGARYAYGYDPERALHELFKIRGIPFAVLIDPYGTIVWSGHPLRLSEECIESALDGALERPVWCWPEDARALGKTLQRGEYAAASSQANDLPASGDFDPVAAVRERVAAVVAHFEHAVEREDYRTAFQFAGRMQKELGSLPEAAALVARVQELQERPEVRRLLPGMERLARLEQEASATKESASASQAVRVRVEELAKEYTGTRVERLAQTLISEIDKTLARARKKS